MIGRLYGAMQWYIGYWMANKLYSFYGVYQVSWCGDMSQFSVHKNSRISGRNARSCHNFLRQENLHISCNGTQGCLSVNGTPSKGLAKYLTDYYMHTQPILSISLSATVLCHLMVPISVAVKNTKAHKSETRLIWPIWDPLLYHPVSYCTIFPMPLLPSVIFHTPDSLLPVRVDFFFWDDGSYLESW